MKAIAQDKTANNCRPDAKRPIYGVSTSQEMEWYTGVTTWECHS
jgi:hypothetical protein